MFGKSIRLFNLLGFEVKVDFSWIIIALLIAWSLSTGMFPLRFEGLSPATYWLMGITGAAGLFISIIIHEFAHSIVARKNGIQMKGITLFIFGGVAEMDEEPPNAGAEFRMAIVGPLASLAIGLFFYLIYLFRGNIPEAVAGVIGYLAMINVILAIFNMIPAFPLDGGRVLRSILWGIKKNLHWATRVSSTIGSTFGLFLILFGVINFISGNFVGGMWWFLIGMFLRNAAKASYQRLITRRALEGEPISRFMVSDPVTVHPDISLEQFVNDYIYRYQHKLFPVVEDDTLKGCVITSRVKDVNREDWKNTKLETIMEECSGINTIGPEKDAIEALSLMNSHNRSRLMVVDGNKLKGIVSLKDMLRFLSLKIELEQ